LTALIFRCPSISNIVLDDAIETTFFEMQPLRRYLH
jgi:hypothetical protein